MNEKSDSEKEHEKGSTIVGNEIKEEAIKPKEEAQESIDSILKPDEIKKLEEKERYELEYFSKDECLEKIQHLEKSLEENEEKLKKLQEENENKLRNQQKLQAEFENAQKRWDKNRQNLRTEYTASVLKNFLPLYDSFKKALETANEDEKNILNGFYTQFMNIYKSYKAEPMHVEVNSQFDYSIHEALTSVEKEDMPENNIIEVVQDGWKYGKEVIRYAKVIISRKPKPPEPEPEEEKIEEKEAEESISEEVTTEQVKIEEENKKEKKIKKHKKDKKKEKSE